MSARRRRSNQIFMSLFRKLWARLLVCRLLYIYIYSWYVLGVCVSPLCVRGDSDRLACVNYTISVPAYGIFADPKVGRAQTFDGARPESQRWAMRGSVCRCAVATINGRRGSHFSCKCMRTSGRVGQQLVLNQTTHLNWNVASALCWCPTGRGGRAMYA